MLKRSDIVQIPFPFSDLIHQKRRPVLNRDSVLVSLGSLKPAAFERIHGKSA